jgi:hypothetical protein
MSDTILINLNIISKISPNDKIFINGEGYISIENSTILQGVVRFLYSNSRSKSIHNLTNFYSGVFKYIDSCVSLSPALLHQNHRADCGLLSDGGDANAQHAEMYSCLETNKAVQLKTLYLYLQKSTCGIENLKQTYQTDVVITSKIDIILDSIRQYSSKLNSYISAAGLTPPPASNAARRRGLIPVQPIGVERTQIGSV